MDKGIDYNGFQHASYDPTGLQPSLAGQLGFPFYSADYGKNYLQDPLVPYQQSATPFADWSYFTSMETGAYGAQQQLAQPPSQPLHQHHQQQAMPYPPVSSSNSGYFSVCDPGNQDALPPPTHSNPSADLLLNSKAASIGMSDKLNPGAAVSPANAAAASAVANSAGTDFVGCPTFQQVKEQPLELPALSAPLSVATVAMPAGQPQANPLSRCEPARIRRNRWRIYAIGGFLSNGCWQQQQQQKSSTKKKRTAGAPMATTASVAASEVPTGAASVAAPSSLAGSGVGSMDDFAEFCFGGGAGGGDSNFDFGTGGAGQRRRQFGFGRFESRTEAGQGVRQAARQ
uniref:YTH domain-containing protein n=1 Tax=Macrostomum lignano TaxID=282301 RepID=A0A1I8J850_9PLAT